MSWSPTPLKRASKPPPLLRVFQKYRAQMGPAFALNQPGLLPITVPLIPVLIKKPLPALEAKCVGPTQKKTPRLSAPVVSSPVSLQIGHNALDRIFRHTN